MGLKTENGSSQGQNLALSGLCVPSCSRAVRLPDAPPSALNRKPLTPNSQYQPLNPKPLHTQTMASPERGYGTQEQQEQDRGTLLIRKRPPPRTTVGP